MINVFNIYNLTCLDVFSLFKYFIKNDKKTTSLQTKETRVCIWEVPQRGGTRQPNNHNRELGAGLHLDVSACQVQIPINTT